MAITVSGPVQNFGFATGAGITISTAPVNQSAGKTLAVFVQSYNTAAGVAVTDTAGNTYISSGNIETSASNASGYWYYVLSCLGNAANVVSAALSGSDGGYQAIHVYEISGAGLFLQSVGNDAGVSPDADVDSGPFSFSAQPAIIIGGMAGGNPGFTNVTGFTLTLTTDGLGGYSASEYKLVSAAENATATFPAAYWYMNAIAFGVASAGSSGLIFNKIVSSKGQRRNDQIQLTSNSNTNSSITFTRSALPSSGPTPPPDPPGSNNPDDLWFFRNRRRYR